ncbi:MAG: hypothetical protein A3B53_03325 [Candidatus Levybacteria bacterium RIFCSPLOWO2_01_FULL_42_15]|nr:MAG: hypothetical protein A3B53_03325 [Candidatus Levybacteria bacterium RIFCSPLOWO2_01_FULL_42_15]
MEPSVENPEKSIRKEQRRVKHLPPSIGAMFGKGFEQLVAPDIKEAQPLLEALTLDGQSDRFASRFLDVIKDDHQRFVEVPKKLQRAKTVLLVYEKGQWDFEFLGEEQIEENLPSSATLEGKLLYEFIQAFTHHVKTPLSAGIGFSELIRDRSQDETVKRIAEQYHQVGRNILQKITQFDNATCLTMTRSEDGGITLTPSRSERPLSPPAS